MSLTHADLCSGIGGFSLAARMAGGFRTVLYCEIEPYCREVLLARMHDGQLDAAPIAHDLRWLDGSAWRGRLDLLTAGFPCQPYSLSGDRTGADHDGDAWPATREFVRVARPRALLLENVPGILSMPEWGTVLGELADCGYVGCWFCLPASAFGFYHERERLWVVAYREGEHGATHDLLEACREWRPQLESRRFHSMDMAERGQQPHARLAGEPGLARMVRRLPDTVDRTSALGNSIVPQVAAPILSYMRDVLT